MSKQYRVKAFSKLTSVTVRALQYYDEIGLLRPRQRTGSGHRLYSDEDIPRLQQITTLKFLGFSLAQIKRILSSESFDVAASLEIQGEMIAEEAVRLEKVGQLIQQAKKCWLSKVISIGRYLRVLLR